MQEFVEQFVSLCKKKPRRIVFPEALDVRILETARFLVDHRLAFPLLLGVPSAIRDFAARNKISTQGIRISHPLHDPEFNSYVKKLSMDKEINRTDAEELLRDPLNIAHWMVKAGTADLCIAGNVEKTDHVLRSAIRYTGVKPGVKTVSGAYLMVAPDNQKILLFADCIVTPRPTSEQSAEIAVQSAETYTALTGDISRVAMLSFSTAGSAAHEMADKVREAVAMVKKNRPSLLLEGEIQIDAAIVPEIAAQKAPNGRLQGQANVFVFPSLNAADSGWKILKELAGYTAIGSFLQGLNGRVIKLCDTCTTDDIINIALVASGL